MSTCGPIWARCWRRGLVAALAGMLVLLLWPAVPTQAAGLPPSPAGAVPAPAAWLQPAHPLLPRQPTHALPVHYDPAPNAVLSTPPAKVTIVYNEQVNPDISKIVVVNPSNQEVDNRDSQVSADGLTMTVTLPLLPAGTYVVFWRTHSADDGHIVGGSYLFHIARADGTVPPLSGPLPTGSSIGGAGLANGNGVTGPALLGSVARWIVLLGLTVLLGLVFWSLVVQPRQTYLTAGLAADVGRQMRRTAELALVVILGATLLEVASQAVALDGTAQGVISAPLLHSILFGSRFGLFILLRAGLVLLGLLLLWLAAGREGFDRTIQAAAVSLFGLGLALVVEYSGHGGSDPVWWGPPIDFVHLLANGVWLGGLFTLVLVIFPVLRRRGAPERHAYLATALPAFSVPALAAVAVLVVTGPLNATTRMTSIPQLWTTAYGILLVVKSVLFLCMAAISYHHAFRLRPRLAQLAQPAGDAAPAPAAGSPRARFALPNIPLLRVLNTHLALLLGEPVLSAQLGAPDGSLAFADASAVGTTAGSVGARRHAGAAELTQTMMRWMQAEAVLGATVLLCAALLGTLAGTLAPPVPTTNSFGASGGAQVLTQKADTLTVTLTVSPGKFGTNTFTVVVKNPDGTFASDGTVFLVSQMVEMDMGVNTINLTATAAPGTYTGQGELAMAGHWTLMAVIRTRQDPNNLHRTTFTISASY